MRKVNMKTAKIKGSNLFTTRIIYTDKGLVCRCIKNAQIHGGLMEFLEKKMEEAVYEFNKNKYWSKEYISFEHEGKTYKQVDSDKGCLNCAFLRAKTIECCYPHFDSKPTCQGKIYLEKG